MSPRGRSTLVVLSPAARRPLPHATGITFFGQPVSPEIHSVTVMVSFCKFAKCGFGVHFCGFGAFFAASVGNFADSVGNFAASVCTPLTCRCPLRLYLQERSSTMDSWSDEEVLRMSCMLGWRRPSRAVTRSTPRIPMASPRKPRGQSERRTRERYELRRVRRQNRIQCPNDRLNTGP